MKKVMYQGVELTIWERADWEPAKYPVKGTYRFRIDPNTGDPIPGSGYLLDSSIFVPRESNKVTHQAIHYTADDELPDGDPGEGIANVFTYVQAMQTSYARNRAYSVGYNWFVDYLGGIWEGRGYDIKCAAHAPANTYADAILVLIDLGKPINDLMAHSIRYLTEAAMVETHRIPVQVGHRELPGTNTACPGDLIVSQIHSGFLRPRPIIQPPQPPTDIFGGNDMAQLIQATDGDIAVFSVTGTFVEWISTQGRGDALVLIKAVDHAGPEGVPPMQPVRIDRGFFQYFTLVGPQPVYPTNYTGPKTTAADFARWVM